MLFLFLSLTGGTVRGSHVSGHLFLLHLCGSDHQFRQSEYF